MVGDAVAADPGLTQFTRALAAAGYRELLGDTSSGFTVFAPTDSAFAALAPGRLDALLADPTGELTTLLAHLVSGQRLDESGLLERGSVRTLDGKDATITGTAGALVVDGTTVSCGNIPTLNATLFLLDAVPPTAGS